MVRRPIGATGGRGTDIVAGSSAAVVFGRIGGLEFYRHLAPAEERILEGDGAGGVDEPPDQPETEAAAVGQLRDRFATGDDVSPSSASRLAVETSVRSAATSERRLPEPDIDAIRRAYGENGRGLLRRYAFDE